MQISIGCARGETEAGEARHAGRFRWQGYRFFFFSNEGDPQEPIHVHIRKGDKVAKFWVRPGVGLADSHGMTTAELKLLTQVVEAQAELIERRWHEYFSH